MTAIRRAAAAAFGVLVLGASACGVGSGDGNTDGRVAVVASTDVWGSVAAAVGGDLVSVTTIVDDPAADPHSYESTAADGLAVTKADLMVANGGGYDGFAAALAEQVDGLPVVDAFALSEHAAEEEHAEEDTHVAEDQHAAEEEHAEEDKHGHDHAGANEHVWFDLATVGAVADAVAHELGEIQPGHEAQFADNAASFRQELDSLEARLHDLRTVGASAVATEPVAQYLLDDAGIEDATPQAYSNAIEGETDVPVAVQQQVFKLVEGGSVSIVVNNPQTQTPVTRQLVAKADRANVPVVEIGETLPEGVTEYVAWVSASIDALEAALDR